MFVLIIQYLLLFPGEYFPSKMCDSGGNFQNICSYTIHDATLILYISYYEYKKQNLPSNSDEILQNISMMVLRPLSDRKCFMNVILLYSRDLITFIRLFESPFQIFIITIKDKSNKMANVLRAVMNTGIAALRHERYAFQALNQSHAKQAIDLLTVEFESQQPLTNAVFKRTKTEKAKKTQEWRAFWTVFAEDFLRNQYSVGCFDTQNGDQLIGISVAKDLNYVPPHFQRDYMDTNSFIAPVIRLQEQLLRQIRPQYQPLLSKKDIIMDIWGVALKKEHMGKRLLHKMIAANQILGRQKGFQYGFCYASNFKTGKALSKLEYEKVAEMNVLQYVEDEQKPFVLIEDLYKNPSLWMKSLENSNLGY